MAAADSDMSDEEWALAAPYLTLMRENAGLREHLLRELLNGLRYVVCTGVPWRAMPHDLPPWEAVYGQATRWTHLGYFNALAQDLPAVLHMAGEREPEPTTVMLDNRTLRSAPESGARAGYDGAKPKRGSKVHPPVSAKPEVCADTLGDLLVLHMTSADASDRDAVERLAQKVQDATGKSAEMDYVDQGYAGERPAATHGIRLEVVKPPEAKRGFVLLYQRCVVKRSLPWATRCRRLVRDYKCPIQALADMHTVAFPILMLRKAGGLAQIHKAL